MLHDRNVSRLVEAGAVRGASTNPVRPADDHDPRDAQMVHIQGQDEARPQIAAVAPGQGRRRFGRADHRREAPRGEREAGRFPGRLLRSVQGQQLQAPAHIAGTHVLPADVGHQRRNILHRVHLQGRLAL